MSTKSVFTVQLVNSPIGCPETQRATVRGLGLRRLHQLKELKDTPENRGMVFKVAHLVNVVAAKKKGK
ncbi:MAG: 50S ribosomal protein L30 [Deltaproteobacteria bacterium RIFCSPLOWO2_02_FULL_46_8]|nr:MAG: 50S ribosomal protein L30 [Deltaproteobacteria bacterium RIFCSPLOWO2_02_FULL_46_8]